MRDAGSTDVIDEVHPQVAALKPSVPSRPGKPSWSAVTEIWLSSDVRTVSSDSNSTSIMGNSRSLQRETQNLLLANIASRVAAAARRAADGRPITADWQLKALAEVEERLRSAANALKKSKISIGHARKSESYVADDNTYALARLTRSAVVLPSSPPDISDDQAQERITASMIQLADGIGVIRNKLDSAERRQIANELNVVFKRVSAIALAQFSRPGDTIGEPINDTFRG